MDLQSEKHDRVFSYLDAHARQTLSMFGNVDKETALRMLQRYQSAAGRAYSRAFRMLKELQGDRFGRMPATQPVSPEQNRDRQEAETPRPTHDRQGVEPLTAYAPKVIVFKRHNPENTKLQSEPEPLRMAAA
jgi:hypothetical protein